MTIFFGVWGLVSFTLISPILIIPENNSLKKGFAIVIFWPVVLLILSAQGLIEIWEDIK